MNYIVYEPFSEGRTDAASCLVTAFTAAESYEYCRNWNEAGEFTLVVPVDTVGIEKVREDMLLLVQDEFNSDSLVITSVTDNGRNVVLKGFDLKIMLKWRVTLFPDEEFDKGTYGYDVATGSTGEIIQHYIERNFINPRDSNRKIIGLVAPNLGGGILNDTYMSRMEPVYDVVQKLCKNADIGYDIVLADNSYYVVIQEGIDRTNANTTYGKVVFADYTFDADCITVETQVNDRNNIIWAVNGSDADTATVISVDNSETDSEGNQVNYGETVGFMRREAVATTNCEIDEIQIYARKTAEDKFNKTSITFELKDYTLFINRFYVGDKITVLKGGRQYNKRVLSAVKSYTAGAKTIKIRLGDIPEKKPLTKLDYENHRNQKDIIDEKLEKVAKAKNDSSSDSSILSSVTFEKNRLYYNGETYYLQFGFNKRIMCVTKGNKYALINSEGYTESRIEAATAVMKGLTEDWDLEFDYYAVAGNSLSITSIAQGCSGVTKCDWGDGTTDSETTHSYSITAPVKVKTKLSGCSGVSLYFNSLTWATEGNTRYEEGYGAGIHIGGNFEIVNVYCNLYADYITFGEKVKRINEGWSGSIFSAPSKVSKRGHEHGIPPFVEVIGSPTFQYSGSSYLYIPESCTSIKDDAFYCGCASEIEIEPKGETLTLGRCFRKPDGCTGGNRVTKLNIPARVKASASGVFEGCGVGAVKFEKGCTEIAYNLSYNMDYSCGHFRSLNNAEPYFIFIPDTVMAIGNNLICSDTNGRQVYIIYGGSKMNWENVAKAANWDGASGGRENVTVVCDSYLYNRYDNVLKSYVRR